MHAAWAIARATWQRFVEHAAMLAAAAAYYTVLSVVPLIIIAVAIAAVWFDEAEARRELLDAVHRHTSPAVGTVVAELVSATQHPSTQLAAMPATLVLVWAASRFFAQIQGALNLIWGVRVRSARGVWPSARRFAVKRAVSFAMVICCGALLLVSLVLQALLVSFGAWVTQQLGMMVPPVILAMEERAISFLLLTVLFALIFRVLPDAVVRLRDVWPGAMATSALTLVGTWLLSSYTTIVGPAWLQGSIGSVAAFMLWAYYLGQVFFLGAAFTRVWSDQRAGGIEPEPYAELITAETA